MEFTGLSLIDAALVAVKKKMSALLDRIHHSYYNDIMHLHRNKVYNEVDILTILCSQRQAQLKQNPMSAYLHYDEARYIAQLKLAINDSWGNLYNFLNKSSKQLNSYPEVQKILQTFFSIYTYHWQKKHLIHDKALSIIKPINTIQAHTEYKALCLLNALEELDIPNIADYLLRNLRQKFQTLVNLIARGLLPASYSSKLATLCLTNLQHTLDFETYQGFMAGMKYLIPNLTTAEREKLIEQFKPIKPELKENPYKLLTLQGCLKLYHLQSEAEIDSIIDQFIALKELLIHHKEAPLIAENHLYGFDSEAPEPGKTNALQQHMYSSFLTKHTRYEQRLSNYNLSKLIAKFHLRLAQLDGPLLDDHYAMLLLDRIRGCERNFVHSDLKTNPQQ